MQVDQSELFQNGLKHLEKWQLDEAKQCFKAHLENHPQDAEALNKLGIVCANQQKLRKLQNILKQGLTLIPN